MLPETFLSRMEKMLEQEYPAFLEAMKQEPYKALRINVGKIGVKEFQDQSPWDLRPVPWTANGFYYEEQSQPGKHPFHEAGAYYIQEPSAMAPVTLLEPGPGEKILDLCAAPGGKSTQIGEAMGGQGILISNEIHPGRAAILAENVERMGLRNCIVTNETSEKLAQLFPGYFDKILVVAPCSGEGMFRKNEEACREWSPENVALCADRQDQVLEQAALMLRPGGRLVYSTCTFAPEENEGSVSRFLEKHPEFHVFPVELPEGFAAGRPEWICSPAEGVEHTVRLMPHKLRGEGHFMAVLEKAGEGPGSRCRGGLEKSLPPKSYEEYTTFLSGILDTGISGKRWTEGVFLRFGEQLYLGPEDMPGLKGLRVLRPGLHLGSLKKGRLEPSHAMGLALKPAEVKQHLSLDPEGLPVRQFLGGQTLILGEETGLFVEDAAGRTVETPAGWCLICVGNLSLGWGKITGNVVKNHYPRGLRKA